MNFKQLCENYNINVFKTVKREFYPRQIKFSPEFLTAVREEYKRQHLSEDIGINNHRAKFLKALNFHLRELDNTRLNEEDVKKSQGINKKSIKGRPT